MSEPRDEGPPGTQDACCAHTRVSYRTREERSGLVVEGWWECDSGCGTRFVPSRGALPPPGSAPDEPNVRCVIGEEVSAYMDEIGVVLSPATIDALQWRIWRALDGVSALRGAQPASRVPSPAEGEVSHVAACQCPECKEWRAQPASQPPTPPGWYGPGDRFGYVAAPPSKEILSADAGLKESAENLNAAARGESVQQQPEMAGGASSTSLSRSAAPSGAPLWGELREAARRAIQHALKKYQRALPCSCHACRRDAGATDGAGTNGPCHHSTLRDIVARLDKEEEQ